MNLNIVSKLITAFKICRMRGVKARARRIENKHRKWLTAGKKTTPIATMQNRTAAGRSLHLIYFHCVFAFHPPRGIFFLFSSAACFRFACRPAWQRATCWHWFLFQRAISRWIPHFIYNILQFMAMIIPINVCNRTATVNFTAVFHSLTQTNTWSDSIDFFVPFFKSTCDRRPDGLH